MKSKKLTSLIVTMMSVIIMLGMLCLPASAAKSISDATVSYEVYQTYTGKAIKPSVTVKVGGKKLTKDKSYTVTYKSNTDVGKGYIVIKGKGSYSGTIKKGFYIQPKATSSLKATGYSTKIKLTWSKVTGAKGYQVYQYNSTAGKWVKLPTVTKNTTTVTGLDSVTTYKFKVRPYAKVGSKTIFGEWKTVSKSTTIGKPTSIEFCDITESSATLKWNKIDGATSYTVNYVNSSSGYSSTVTSATESVKLTGLGKGTLYKVKISAVNSSKKITGNYSDIFTFTTSPAAVTITKAEANSSSQVKLAWTASAGASGYTVYYGKADSQGNVASFTEAGTVSATSATIGPFTPGNTYVFKVVAFTKTTSAVAYSAEALSEAVLIPVKTVTGFTATAVTKSSVSFSWDRPSDIDGYKLYKNGELVASLEPATTQYTFSGLSEGVSYNFAISTYYKSQESEKTSLTVSTGSGAVESVYFTSKPSVLRPGETYTLAVSVLPADATDKSLIYESGNTAIATVSDSGVIRAIADGKTNITVKSRSNPDKKASFTLTVRTSDVLTTAITLPSQITMYEGDLISLNPVFSPADATNKSYTVTGQDYTYSYKGGIFGTSTKSDTCEFDSYISITTNNLLKAKKATITPKGDEEEFSFTVTVKAADGSGKTATTKIKVLPKMLTVQYNGMEDMPWYYGNSVQLYTSIASAIESDYDDSDIRYKSSDTSVATVTNSGIVTCKGSGDVTITAYTSDGKYSGTFDFYSRGIVDVKKTYFESCRVGQTYQINAGILPATSDDTVMYYSLNPSVASVNANGLVSFLSSGNAMIAVVNSSDTSNYKQVWFTSGSFTAPSGTNAQLLSRMTAVANSAKTFTAMPNVTIKEKHVFENLSASTTSGTTADVSSLESTIANVFPATTTYLSESRSTKEDYINNIPLRGESYVIASGLTENDLKSITVKDSGEYYYEMTMVLKEESLTTSSTIPTATRHGKVFQVLTQSLYEELKEKTGLDPDFDSVSLKYHDCSLTLKVNKVTGNIENATYNMTTDVAVKNFKLSALISGLNASATYNNIITVDFSGYNS